MSRARILAALEGIEPPEAWDEHGADSRQEARLEIALLRALDRAEAAEARAIALEGAAPDLDALAALVGAATRGPWRVRRDEHPYVTSIVAGDGEGLPRVLDGDSMGDLSVSEQDAAFVVAAREAVPALIARVRTLEARAEYPIEDAALSIAHSRTGYRGTSVREALNRIMQRIDTAEAEAGTCAEAVFWAAGHLGIEMPKGRACLASELAPAVALACGKEPGGAPLWVRVTPAPAALSPEDEARARGVMVGPGYGGTSGGAAPPPSNLSGMELEAERLCKEQGDAWSFLSERGPSAIEDVARGIGIGQVAVAGALVRLRLRGEAEEMAIGVWRAVPFAEGEAEQANVVDTAGRVIGRTRRQVVGTTASGGKVIR